MLELQDILKRLRQGQSIKGIRRELGRHKTVIRKVKKIAAEHDISLGLCKCKNPDVTADCCHPQPPLTGSDVAQGTLF